MKTILFFALMILAGVSALACSIWAIVELCLFLFEKVETYNWTSLYFALASYGATLLFGLLGVVSNFNDSKY